MIITNAKLNGELKNIELLDGKISKISENTGKGDLDACGMRVIPGMIDIHTHGYGGVSCDGDWEALSHAYASHGTTSALVTCGTIPMESMVALDSRSFDVGGANLLGLHYEGPYINLAKKGGMDERYAIDPVAEDFLKLKNAKVVSVAPELPGAMDFIREVSAAGVHVALGHTTADYDTALEAFQNGAAGLTHMFNAMPGMLHRDPGPIGAALMSGNYVQLICDGFHVSRPVILAAFKMFGDKVVMISDSLINGGMPEGVYPSAEGYSVIVKDKTLVNENGTIVGSYLCLLEGVKVCTEIGIPFETAVDAASRIPAELLGVKKGRVAVGYDADLLIVDEEINLKHVILRGKLYQ